MQAKPVLHGQTMVRRLSTCTSCRPHPLENFVRHRSMIAAIHLLSQRRTLQRPRPEIEGKRHQRVELPIGQRHLDKPSMRQLSTSPDVLLDAHQTHSSQVCAPCSAIQRRTSSTRQTVTRGESFTGAGNVPATTRRHKVDLDMGTKVNTCGCRRKPVSGRVTLVESVADMI